jgi:hypothetical protein
MCADPTAMTHDGATLVGVRSGVALDASVVAELRAVAARADVAYRVLAILEPGDERTQARTGQPLL